MAKRRTALARRTASRSRSSRSATLNKYKQQIAAARSRSTRLAKKVKAERGGDLKKAAIVVAGGAASGAVSAKLPSIGPVQTPALLGAALVGAGCFAVKGQMGGTLCLLGAGMLAASANDAVAGMFISDEEAEVAAAIGLAQGMNQ